MSNPDPIVYTLVLMAVTAVFTAVSLVTPQSIISWLLNPCLDMRSGEVDEEETESLRKVGYIPAAKQFLRRGKNSKRLILFSSLAIHAFVIVGWVLWYGNLKFPTNLTVATSEYYRDVWVFAVSVIFFINNFVDLLYKLLLSENVLDYKARGYSFIHNFAFWINKISFLTFLIFTGSWIYINNFWAETYLGTTEPTSDRLTYTLSLCTFILAAFSYLVQNMYFSAYKGNYARYMPGVLSKVGDMIEFEEPLMVESNLKNVNKKIEFSHFSDKVLNANTTIAGVLHTASNKIRNSKNSDLDLDSFHVRGFDGGTKFAIVSKENAEKLDKIHALSTEFAPTSEAILKPKQNTRLIIYPKTFGFHVFDDNVLGIGYYNFQNGMGVWFYIHRLIVFTVTVAMFGFYQLLTRYSLNGTLLFLITTLVPLLEALGGKFHQWWELFRYHTLIGLIIMMLEPNIGIASTTLYVSDPTTFHSNLTDFNGNLDVTPDNYLDVSYPVYLGFTLGCLASIYTTALTITESFRKEKVPDSLKYEEDAADDIPDPVVHRSKRGIAA